MWQTAQIESARAAVADWLGESPRIALVLGSGLGAFADRLSDARSLEYGKIPHFPVSTVPGHAGRLVVGRSGTVPVLVLQGRSHLYEGNSAEHVTFPTRVLAALGVQKLLLTNAAGAVNTGLAPGQLMLITDHINLTGANPLIGPNDDALGPRFPDMTTAYDPELCRILREAAGTTGVPLREGVYLACTGPSYETPAEVRMYRALGADACGMSTVLEVIAALHAGMSVAAFSCITNMGAGISAGKLHHDEVTDAAALVMDGFGKLMEAALPRILDA